MYGNGFVRAPARRPLTTRVAAIATVTCINAVLGVACGSG